MRPFKPPPSSQRDLKRVKGSEGVCLILGCLAPPSSQICPINRAIFTVIVTIVLCQVWNPVCNDDDTPCARLGGRGKHGRIRTRTHIHDTDTMDVSNIMLQLESRWTVLSNRDHLASNLGPLFASPATATLKRLDLAMLWPGSMEHGV